jgi:MSHA type pilus biogenesis protein MshL
MYRIAYLITVAVALVGCRELANRTEINPPITPKDLKTLTSTPDPISPRITRNKQPETIKPPTYPANFYNTVSIAVTENIPLKPILSELSRQAKVDLQLDCDIKSQVVFQATDRPFIEIIEDLCELTDLRFRIKNMALRIERDTPYSENYNIQFLNLSRTSQNRISVATDVFAQNGTQTQTANNDNGSNSSVSVETKNDFWSELDTNLKVLLAQDNKKHTKQKANEQKEESTYSVHKQGGLITVYAPEKAHKRIKNYLKKLKYTSSRQVLIEAKIIEVTLKEEYRAGINWQKLGTRSDLQLDAMFGSAAQKSRFLDPSDAQQSLFSFGAKGTTFSAILNALQEFGHSRTLSSPRLTVMNNQTAILKVAQNQVYFRMNYDKQYSTNVDRNNVSISSDIQTVPIGLVMSVQPSIDPDTGEIILFLRPTISRLNKSVSDPAVDIAYNANLSATGTNTTLTPSMVPVVEVREIDSVLRLQNGEIGIMGGLMEVRSYKDTNKIPGLGDLYIAKEIFSSNNEGEYVVELIIAVKVTIPPEGAPSPDAADTRITTDYIADSRKWSSE